MNAIDEYWFDVHGDNFPKGYTPSVVTMVWGGKGANATWFSAKPEMVHGINWLPIQGGSLYLGRHPDYVEKNYAALVKENGGKELDGVGGPHLDVSGVGRSGGRDQAAGGGGGSLPGRGRDSRANAVHWIYSLNELGRVDADVTADYPIYAVFQKGKKRTYCICNMTDEARTVMFSDGFRLKAEGKGFAHATAGE